MIPTLHLVARHIREAREKATADEEHGALDYLSMTASKIANDLRSDHGREFWGLCRVEGEDPRQDPKA